MKINNCKIVTILLLSLLSVVPVSADTNSLTQLDIRKNNSSSSAVDVTLYTTTPYNDSVAVTKKSDNKYVILMPNVSSSAGRSPDLSGLKDVISNVDIKSVNDGTGSYTKVTLITTKPVNIKTHTQKSLPVTSGQKAYRELLTQTGTHTNAPVQVKPALKEVPQTIVTVNKPAQPVKVEAKPETKPKTETVKPAVVQKAAPLIAKAQNTIKEVSVKKESNLKENAVKVVKKADKTVSEPVIAASAPASEVNPSVNNNNVPEAVPQPTAPQVSAVETSNLPAASAAPVHRSILSKLNNYIGRILSNMPITLSMIIIPIAGLVLLFKLIKSSMTNSNMLKKSFIANLKKKEEVKDYEDIINADMNWQEKYQKFVAVSNKNYEKSPKKLASETIGTADIAAAHVSSAKPAVEKRVVVKSSEKGAVNAKPVMKKQQPLEKASPKIEINEAVREMERQIDKLENEKAAEKAAEEIPVVTEASKKAAEEKTAETANAEYAASLERMLHASPDIEKTDLDEDIILKELEQNFKDITVHSEDNMITSQMSNVSGTVKIKKLKAFANNPVLDMTRRTKPLPKTREDVKRAVNMEGRHVNLGYSKLHSNPRILEGANLSAADLIAKSSRFLPNPAPKVSAPKPVISQIGKPKVKMTEPVNSKGYSMATIDEFFALTDPQSKVTASSDLSDKVAGSLANIKPSMKMQKASPAKMSNPISNLKSKNKEDYLNGLIVKSGYNIDNEKGFYLVNLDGETALIGRIKEEVFVLKKFDSSIERPIQVRQDNPNVYMVKTDGFRSLVEVNEDKMGVLIEL